MLASLCVQSLPFVSKFISIFFCALSLPLISFLYVSSPPLYLSVSLFIAAQNLTEKRNKFSVATLILQPKYNTIQIISDELQKTRYVAAQVLHVKVLFRMNTDVGRASERAREWSDFFFFFHFIRMLLMPCFFFFFLLLLSSHSHTQHINVMNIGEIFSRRRKKKQIPSLN